MYFVFLKHNKNIYIYLENMHEKLLKFSRMQLKHLVN